MFLLKIMHLTHITTENFRNLQSKELKFAPGITIFVGQNAQGKTNILEAIYTFSLSRPFRSNTKEVFTMQGKDFSRITAKVHVGQDVENLQIFWGDTGTKKSQTICKKNDVQLSPTEFLKQKHFFAVLFAPEDMELMSNAPQKRRRFLSRILSPLFPEYLEALLKYEKVLKHRNKLLSEFPKGKIQKQEFDFWDAELVKWGEIIQKYRQEFADFTHQHITRKYQSVSETNEEVKFLYTPSIKSGESFFKTLEKSFAHDVRYGSTQKGPHRDDFQILLRNQPLEETASRGELRSALVALKLCERDFIAEVTSFSPVLILDDVLSELDEKRRGALLKNFENQQVFISCTHLPEKFEGEVFEVREGKITTR